MKVVQTEIKEILLIPIKILYFDFFDVSDI